MDNKNKKILIIRLSALGDTIHTLPVAYALKQKYPDCKIGWVVEDKAKLFIENNPLVDYCYVIPKKEWKKRGFSVKNIREFFDIVKKINAEKFDIALDTQQLFKSSSLLPFLQIKRKISLTGGREFYWLFNNEFVKESHTLFDSEYHVVKRNLELAEYLGANTDNFKIILESPSEDIRKKVDALLHNIDKTKKNIVISPATTWDNKHWNELHWNKVIKAYENKVNLIFTGTDADKPLIDRILVGTNLENKIILAGKTDLKELLEVFRRADVVISPDSGSAHVAWAAQKPAIITLFSATAEKRSAPFGPNCYVLAPALDCRPCLRKDCRLKNDKNKCCSLVQPEELIALLDNLI